MVASKFGNLDTDKTLGGSNASDQVIASQKAIKDYVDGQTVASLNDIGDVAITSPSQGQNLTYDATTQKWKNTSTTATVGWGGITGNMKDQSDLAAALDDKQDKLTAGNNITIVEETSGITEVPEGYIQLTYLESTGSQSIDVGTCSSGYVEVDFAPIRLTGTQGSGYDGVCGINGAPQLGWFGNASTSTSGWTQGNTASTAPYPPVVGTKYTYKWTASDGKLYIDDISTGISRTGTLTLNLFYCESNPKHARIYEFRQYDASGALTKRLIPCVQQSSGKASMYDVVNNQFYEPFGTFVKGKPLSVLKINATVPTKTSQLENDSNFAKTNVENTFTKGQTISRADSGAILKLTSAAGDTNFILERQGGSQCVLESGQTLGLFGTKTNHPIQIRTNYINRMTIGTNGSVTLATDVASDSDNNQVATTKWVNAKKYITADYHDATKYDASNPTGYITSASVGNGKVTIKRNNIDVSSFNMNDSTNTDINIAVPTTVSELTNDSGYITSASVGNGKITIKANNSEVSSFNLNDSSDKDINITIPTKTNDLENNSGFITNAVSDLANYTPTADLGDMAFADNVTNADISGTIDQDKITGLTTALSGKQPTISDLETIRSDATAGKGAADTISTYGDIVTHNSSEYATAAQGTKADSALQASDIINNVTSTDTNKALSANMGKSLQDQIDNLKSRGRYLSQWNSTTGKPASDPTTLPYEYRAGDYYIVGTVGTTNYKPTGTSYTGAASTTVETLEVAAEDVYYFDGTAWHLQQNTQKTVSFANLSGQPSDNTNLATALNAKADDTAVVHLAGAETITGVKTHNAAVHFANNTWNKMGDDAYIGDCNVGGCIGVKGINGATGLTFVPYSGSTVQKMTINGAGMMTITNNVTAGGSLGVNNNACKMQYNSTTQALDFVFA